MADPRELVVETTNTVSDSEMDEVNVPMTTDPCALVEV